MPRPAVRVTLFLIGALLLALVGPTSPGELVLAGGAYLALWGALERDAVRKLFGPVFAYELTRLGRRKGTYVARFSYTATIGILFVYWFFLWSTSVTLRTGSRSVSGPQAAAFADQFFLAYSLVQFAAIFALAPAFVAGTVAQEKERKTLEFLLATDLSGAEIVFGKAAARLLSVLQFVVAGLGVVVFLQLFGGIDPDLLLASTAASALTAMGITALGLFHSVRARRPREAILATMLTLGVYVFVTFFASNLVRYALPSYLWFAPVTLVGWQVGPADLLWAATQSTDACGAGNPLLAVSEIGRGGVYTTAVLNGALRDYALFWGILSALCLSYAVLRLRPVALRQAEGAPGKSSRTRATSRPEVGDDPVAWKEVFAEPSNRRRGKSVGLILITVLIFSVPAFSAASHFLPDSPRWRAYLIADTRPFPERLADFREATNVWCRVVTGLIAFLTLIGVACRGAGAIVGEKDRDTWVTLSTLPISPWELARGKWLGAALAPRRLYALLLSVWLASVATGSADLLMIGVTAVFFGVYASGFAWLGVWCSVTAKSTLTATIRALFASIFCLGGFWLVLLLTCTLPVGLLNMRTTEVGDAMNEGAMLGYALTPPVMLGIQAAPPWEASRNGPFGPNQTASGPVLPLVGLLAWLLIGWAFAARSHVVIARELNRGGSRPRPGTGSSRSPTRRPPRASTP